MPRFRLTLLLAAVTISACQDSDRPSPLCGIAAMAGPMMVLEGFPRGDGLGEAPAQLPVSLPTRYVAGPLTAATIVQDSAGLVRATVELAAPEGASPGYGVLVTDRSRVPLGILIFDGASIPGAIEMGSVLVSGDSLPLLGIRANPEAFDDAQCPIFAES